MPPSYLVSRRSPLTLRFDDVLPYVCSLWWRARLVRILRLLGLQGDASILAWLD